MSHPLEQKIARLRTRVQVLSAAYGLSCVVGSVLAVVVVLGLIDYLFRFQDPGLRLVCSLLVLSALGVTCYRFLYLPLAFRLRDVELALRLQRRFPALEDRLVSAVEFLRQAEDDPMAGSAALRRAVIAQTTAEAERLDFCAVVDRRPPLRAAMVTAAICLVAAILVLLDPLCCGTALARLANPFGHRGWPQKNHLMLCRPVDRLARGQAFEIEVVDARGAKLPREVRVHYRLQDAEGNTAEETQPMRFVDAASATRGKQGEAARLCSHGMMVARRENVTRPFSYWVEGGDDQSMAGRPIALEVVDPPAIASLSVELVPPAYTGWPAEKTDQYIRALVGTRLEFTAQTTKPLRSAVLCLEQGGEIPAELSGDGRRFTLPAAGGPELLVEKSGAYWFELTDTEGLPGSSSRGEIRALGDAAPTVSIEQPTASTYVTATAEVPLRVVAKDDLAIQQVQLAFTLPQQPQGPPSTLPLYTGPPQPGPQTGGGAAGTGSGDRPVIEYRWELAGLDLSPGSRVSFYATASDYLPQTGRSDPRELIVITPAELQDRIADRQGQILVELARVLKTEQASRSQVGSLEVRLAETEQLGQQDLDRLQAAELNQRQVNQSLSSDTEGVPGRILALLADLRNNKVDSPDVQRRLETLLREIEGLGREHLPPISRELTSAIKTAQVLLEQSAGRCPPEASVAGSLAGAAEHQDQVIASLDRMLAELSKWDNYRRFHRELSELLRDQQELARRTAELGRSTLAKELNDLPPHQRADLKVLAGRQLELARQLERIQQGMQRAGQELRRSDPLAAQTVDDALAEARRLAITVQMLSSGDHLGVNRIGQALRRQQQIIQDLEDVLDILANRREHELVRLLKKLGQEEAALAELERRQADLHARLQQNLQAAGQAAGGAELQRLGREQEELQQETQEAARRLQRLLADLASRTTGQAALQMGQAAQSAAKGAAQAACQQADNARQSLAQARRQLAQRSRQAQGDLALVQLAGLADALTNLRRQQEQAVTETVRFDGLRQPHAELTRAQTAELRDLARRQVSLQQETVRLADALSGAAAFQLALSGAGRDMELAAGMLGQGQTDRAAQRPQRDALRRLDLVLEALKADTANLEPGGAASGQGTTGTGGKPGSGALSLAELTLLKLLQQEINVRTKALEQLADTGQALTDEQRRQYTTLSQEQGQLADLVLQLLGGQQQEAKDVSAAPPEAPPDQEDQPRQSPPQEQSP